MLICIGERSSSPRLRVTRMVYLVGLPRMQVHDMSRSKWEERLFDDAYHQGITEVKGLTRADGEKGD